MGGIVKKALPIATIGAFFIPVVGPYIAIGLSVLQVALSKRPSDDNIISANNNERTITSNRSVQPRTVLFGDCVSIGGSTVDEMSSNKNKYFWRVQTFATHPIAGFVGFDVDGEYVHMNQIEPNGRVNSGKYKNKLYIWTYDGTQTTAPDILVNTFSDWTASDVGNEQAYAIFRFQFDQKVYAGQPPVCLADFRGALLYDPRDQQTRYSDNAVIALQSYLTDFYGGRWGSQIPINDIEESYSIDGANICDEFVPSKLQVENVENVDVSGDWINLEGDTLMFQRRDRVQIDFGGDPPDGLSEGVDYYVIPLIRKKGSGGSVRIQLAATDADAQANIPITINDTGTPVGATVTKNAQPRYRLCGEVKQDTDPGRVVKDMLSAMAGTAPEINGLWRIFPAAWRGSVMPIDQNRDFLSSFKVTTRITRRDRLNTVDGNYFSPINDGKAAGYPRVTNSAYVSADGEPLVGGLDQPFTPSALQAQMVANIMLERNRRTVIGEVDLAACALALCPPDVISIDAPMYGFEGATFEIQRFQWNNKEIKGNPAIVPRVVVQSTDAGIYDFDPALQEQIPDIAPPSQLPNPFDIDPPQNIEFGTSTSLTGENTLIYGIIVTWDAADNFFVLEDGKHEVEYKRQDAGIYQPVPTYDGKATRALINGLQFGETYDIRLRSITHVGGFSSYQTRQYTVGQSGGGVSEQIDLGRVGDPVEETDDLGLVSEPVTETRNFGLVGQ